MNGLGLGFLTLTLAATAALPSSLPLSNPDPDPNSKAEFGKTPDNGGVASISLGQGQGPRAELKINEAAR